MNQLFIALMEKVIAYLEMADNGDGSKFQDPNNSCLWANKLCAQSEEKWRSVLKIFS